MDKVTIFTRGGFGNILKVEAKLVEHGKRKYAQYDSVPFVKFVPKGKRKPVGIQCSYKPYVMILEGWGHELEPDGFYGSTEDRGDVQVRRSRYSSCDPQWEVDFDGKFNHYIKNKSVSVVADYRS